MQKIKNRKLEAQLLEILQHTPYVSVEEYLMARVAASSSGSEAREEVAVKWHEAGDGWGIKSGSSSSCRQQ